jgi:hypothetical protein
MDLRDTRPVDYQTHILIGRTSAGKMTVLWEWPHLPRQLEVQQRMAEAMETYATYLLCTPTSIIGG